MPKFHRSESRISRSWPIHAHLLRWAEDNELLGNKKISVEKLDSTGTGSEEMVRLEFKVPQPVVRTKNKDTGEIRVQSSGPHFTYTFSGKDTLQKSLREFRAFYAKRAHAIAQLRKSVISEGRDTAGDDIREDTREKVLA